MSDRQWLCTHSSVCPSDRLWILPAWSFSHCGHRQSMWSSSSDSSPQKRNIGESALWQSKGLFCVQTQPQRSSRRFFFCSGVIMMLFKALMVAILSMPAVDSLPLMSPRLFPALLHSASSMPCLSSCSHQLSHPSSLHGINKVPFSEERQHNFTASTSAFRATTELPPLPSRAHRSV